MSKLNQLKKGLNMSIIDEETGEVLNTQKGEGAKSFSSFLATLEDGVFHAELTEELRQLNADMNNHVMDYGTAPKGKITITIDILLKGGVFEVVANKVIKKPTPPRQRSMLWSTPGNNFTVSNPKQQDMFKDVSVKGIKNLS